MSPGLSLLQPHTSEQPVRVTPSEGNQGMFEEDTKHDTELHDGKQGFQCFRSHRLKFKSVGFTVLNCSLLFFSLNRSPDLLTHMGPLLVML